MVKNDYIKQEQREEPPPMDESWWNAILNEEGSMISGEDDDNPIVRDEKDFSSKDDFNQELETLDWKKANDIFEKDQVVNMKVIGHNRGGLLVNGEGLEGFVPLSHLIETTSEKRITDELLEFYSDRAVLLKVIECDQGCERVVFSERAALTEPGSRLQLLQSLRADECVTGKVTNITDFGAFVDLGGVEGLVHVSEISWGRVQHPSDAVSLGQQLEVYVIRVDHARSRVALSLKRLQKNPWDSAQNRYSPGQLVDAVITSIVPFGAFARVEDGLDGLIHISEIPVNEDLHQSGFLLEEGQEVKVRILHIDAPRQRMGLSLYLQKEDEI